MTDWMNTVFGDAVPQPLSYVVLFAAVILAILLFLWIAKKLLGGTFVSGGRGRHLRLAVMDATPVDSRRRLVLVRRDEVEHLILIGGPTDVVVEQNIRLDGPRDTKSVPPQRTVVETEPAATEAPPLVREKQVHQLSPAEMRPRTPVPPVAPYLPPRPAAPPPPPTTRYAGASQMQHVPAPAQPLQRPVFPPVVQTPPAPTPTAAPVVAAIPAVAAAAVAASPIAAPTLKSSDSDIDEGLLADLSETLGFDDESAPEISLEKEMESLLGTLDTKKDRIS